MNEFWDNRYSSDGFVYGIAPNEFFKSELIKVPAGRLLSLAEGEGRNGVYAAGLGWSVDAVDFSSVGKEKALKLAAEKKVEINYTVSDLADYQPADETYDAVSIIYMHLNPGLSKVVHKRVVDALKKGGKVIMEVYAKEQLGKDSGGPQNYDMLYSLEEIAENFRELKTEILTKEYVHLNESIYHSGEAVVIRYVGVKE